MAFISNYAWRGEAVPSGSGALELDYHGERKYQ